MSKLSSSYDNPVHKTVDHNVYGFFRGGKSGAPNCRFPVLLLLLARGGMTGAMLGGRDRGGRTGASGDCEGLTGDRGGIDGGGSNKPEECELPARPMVGADDEYICSKELCLG